MRAFFEELLGVPDSRLKLPSVDSAMLLVRNFTLSRHPLYAVPEWTRQFVPERLELVEDGRFKEWIRHNPVDWQVIWDRPHLRRKHGKPERFESVEDPATSSEGNRIIWYRSSEKWKRDEQYRDNAIQAARQDIHRLGERAGKRKLKTREQVQAAVEHILDQTDTRAWVKVAIKTHEDETYKQEGPAR